ncbi:hypothetical protein ATANTOWER_000555 [Ataeniobius toweri]|uniref:Uncharacterized protein n=1 Tax=Ataeniobius toweri TaxID=208326 RepID=A0ABU7CDV5_9TELE|nr:hypothetical protein [Ataeniobius toweri]
MLHFRGIIQQSVHSLREETISILLVRALCALILPDGRVEKYQFPGCKGSFRRLLAHLSRWAKVGRSCEFFSGPFLVSFFIRVKCLTQGRSSHLLLIPIRQMLRLSTRWRFKQINHFGFQLFWGQDSN